MAVTQNCEQHLPLDFLNGRSQRPERTKLPLWGQISCFTQEPSLPSCARPTLPSKSSYGQRGGEGKFVVEGKTWGWAPRAQRCSASRCPHPDTAGTQRNEPGRPLQAGSAPTAAGPGGAKSSATLSSSRPQPRPQPPEARQSARLSQISHPW